MGGDVGAGAASRNRASLLVWWASRRRRRNVTGEALQGVAFKDKGYFTVNFIATDRFEYFRCVCVLMKFYFSNQNIHSYS